MQRFPSRIRQFRLIVVQLHKMCSSANGTKPILWIRLPKEQPSWMHFSLVKQRYSPTFCVRSENFFFVLFFLFPYFCWRHQNWFAFQYRSRIRINRCVWKCVTELVARFSFHNSSSISWINYRTIWNRLDLWW